MLSDIVSNIFETCTLDFFDLQFTILPAFAKILCMVNFLKASLVR